MAIQEEPRSPLYRLHPKPFSYRQRSPQINWALGIAITVAAILVSSDHAVANSTRVSPLPSSNSSLLTVGIYSAVETAQASPPNADDSAWLYQGIVQLSYAGIIAWVIMLLRNSGK
jgi:hypothetical protein